MTLLKSFDAEIYAQYFVNENYNPFESLNGFPKYYIRVGENKNHQPNTLYADTLPASELLLVNDAMAVNVFMENCDPKNEYLIKVIVDRKNKNMDTKILMNPTDEVKN